MIKHLTAENFLGCSGFDERELAPITMIIGENDTGKTGLLKLLYGVMKSLEVYQLQKKGKNDPFKKVLASKLYDVFQPRKGGLGELVTKGGQGKLKLEATFNLLEREHHVHFTFGEHTKTEIVDCSNHLQEIEGSFNALFLPAKEVLTPFEAIAATRENLQMNGFDDTYLDLIKALRIRTQQGRVAKDLVRVNHDLEDLFKGQVITYREGDAQNPFMFNKGSASYTMPFTAEGIKKIGILTTLIRNRQIGHGTILFLDEPETALHPKAVRQLARMLFGMRWAGVRLVLATHNYFMIKQLAILAQKNNASVDCISLDKDGHGATRYTRSDLREGLPDNPIIQEALDMFNEELNLS